MRMFWIAVMGLAGSAALGMAQAAEPPNVLRIVREDVKPGKGAAHEKNEMGYVRAFSKTGYPNYIALEAMTGASQVWFVEWKRTTRWRRWRARSRSSRASR